MNCPYCNNPARWVSNAAIYGRPYGKSYMCWLCSPCDAYVGCHSNTQQPLGTMANKELRQWRMKAHAAIDPLWKPDEEGGRYISRKGLYRYLSEKFGYEVHVAQSDVQQCAAIIAAAKELKEAIEQEWRDDVRSWSSSGLEPV